MSKILAILEALLNLFPSRRESILNEIQDIKDKLHAMQTKPGNWTALDTAEYYKLTDRLQQLEKKSANFGK